MIFDGIFRLHEFSVFFERSVFPTTTTTNDDAVDLGPCNPVGISLSAIQILRYRRETALSSFRGLAKPNEDTLSLFCFVLACSRTTTPTPTIVLSGRSNHSSLSFKP